MRTYPSSFSKLYALLLAGLLLSTHSLYGQNSETTEAPTVSVAQGKLRGSSQADGSLIFLNIPYAEPPVGSLRWKPPQEPKKWDDVRDATKPSAACMQIDWGWNAIDAKSGSEDCLYLNVVTPSLHPDHPMPVIFWIHGGANYNGSGRYVQGETITNRGVVLVSINYRLGILGFLAHPELTAESPHHSSGNYALLDQVQALRWVQRNIAAFGGDPRNVTIAGQSAGAMDVGMLLVSPLGKGLFNRAIDESGGPITPNPELPTLHEAEEVGVAFGAAAGAPPGAGQLAALRALSAEQVLQAGYKYTAPDREGVPTHPGPSTTVDGWVLPRQPAAMVQDGAINPVPLLIGSNIQEFSFSRSSVIQPGEASEPADQLKARIQQIYGEQSKDAIAQYGLDHSEKPPVDPLLGSAGTQLMTDSYFRCPAITTSKWLSSKGRTVYLYQFERPLPGTGSPSTRHSGELPYVFGWAQQQGKGTMGATFGPEDAELSKEMQQYWANFAATGDPNGKGLPHWPEANSSSTPLMRFTAQGRPQLSPDGNRKQCSLFAQHLKELLAKQR